MASSNTSTAPGPTGTGLTLEQSKNRGWEPVLYPDERKSCLERWMHAFQTGEPLEVEHRLGLPADAGYRWHLTRALPLRNDEGQIIQWVGTCTDIHDQKLAHEELEERVAERTADLVAAQNNLQAATERLALATQAANVGIWDWDVTTNTLLWDDAMHQLYGIPLGQFNGTHDGWKARLHPDDLEAMSLAIRSALRDEADYAPEFRTVWPDGSIRHIKANAMILRDANNRAVRMLGTNWDITERKVAEVELHVAKENAEAANRAKSEFLANMSHEIRTPMNGIIGMTDLLETPRPNAARVSRHGQDSAHSLLRLINDILDFSKIEAGKMDLESIAFSLRDCLDGTLQPLVIRAEQKKLKLGSEWASDIPDQVIGDPTRLRQIILNLTDNAIKFTTAGAVTVRIGKNLVEDRLVELQFAVSDSGVGVPPEKQAAIFDAFAQVDGSMTRRFGGTGLGLAIVSQLVRKMGGRIWVESELGRGSTFHFTIRLGLDDSARIPAPAIPAARALAAPSGLRILLAEDNPVNSTVATAILEKLGHSVGLATNGREVVSTWQAHPFDVVFMDIQMPFMDGFEATSRIRELERKTGQHTPIIAMTAHAMAGYRERCLRAGMDGYLPKPISKNEVMQAISECTATLGAQASAVRTPAPEEHEFEIADLLEALDDNDALLGQIANIFTQNTPLLLLEIEQGLASAQGERAARAAHQLAGSTANLHAVRAARLARELEQAAKQGNLARARVLDSALRDEVAIISARLRDRPPASTVRAVA